MTRHLIMDLETGALMVQARDHKRYSLEEIAAAERLAELGDRDAVALLDSLDLDDGGVVDLPQLLHDCPECRAAMARGEQPIIGGPAEIDALRRKPRKPVMRWRAQKRRR